MEKPSKLSITVVHRIGSQFRKERKMKERAKSLNKITEFKCRISSDNRRIYYIYIDDIIVMMDGKNANGEETMKLRFKKQNKSQFLHNQQFEGRLNLQM